jgi:hypothetical protein
MNSRALPDGLDRTLPFKGFSTGEKGGENIFNENPA